MDEIVRRYLKQQAELGGAEAILDGAGAIKPVRSGRTREAAPESPAPRRVAETPAPYVASPAVVATPPAPRSTATEPEPRGEPAMPRESAKAGKPKDWKVGAPPIPGPGIVIPPLATDLLAKGGPDWSSLDEVATAIAGCTACFLAQGRNKVVPGEGNPRAKLVLVGEGPGQTEDETGRPFVGRAGELLTGILGAIGFQRDEVFICNVVKCRPPQNRKPLPDEMTTCSPFLEAQLRLIGPKVILALGATAAEALLQTRRSLGDLRGKVHSYRGTPLVVTYHPAALLRNPNWKKPTWDDVRIARQLVDR